MYPGTAVHSMSGRSEIRTGRSAYSYQLASPRVSIKAGNYVLVVQGRIRSGGLSTGLLDLADDEWLDGTVGDFWYGQVQGKGFVMALDITASANVPVQIVLSNFAPDGGSSVWDISDVALVRQVPN